MIEQVYAHSGPYLAVLKGTTIGNTASIPFHLSNYPIYSLQSVHENTARLSFHAKAALGSSVDPGTITVVNDIGTTVSGTTLSLAGSTDSYVWLKMNKNSAYTITLGTDNSTDGDFEIYVNVVGDTDSDGFVTPYDASNILSNYGIVGGGAQYRSVFDVQRNGAINAADRVELIRNIGAAVLDRTWAMNITADSPAVSTGVDSYDIAADTIQLTGTTTGFAQVLLSIGTDDIYDDGLSVSSAYQGFSFNVKLQMGLNTIKVKAFDDLGQQVIQTILVTRI